MECRDCGYSLDCPSCFSKNSVKEGGKSKSELSGDMLAFLVLESYTEKGREKLKKFVDGLDLTELSELLSEKLNEPGNEELKRCFLGIKRGEFPYITQRFHPMVQLLVEEAVKKIPEGDSDRQPRKLQKGAE